MKHEVIFNSSVKSWKEVTNLLDILLCAILGEEHPTKEPTQSGNPPTLGDFLDYHAAFEENMASSAVTKINRIAKILGLEEWPEELIDNKECALTD